MNAMKTLIVPVDFFHHTDDLVDFAIGIANKLDAQLTFVHVMEHFANAVSYSEVYPASFTEIDEELHGQAQKKMAALLEKSRSTCPGCAGVVLRGDVADGIVDYVREKEIDLIVMGTHGAKGIEKILLGSVAERVLKRASCPILIFNPYKGEGGYQTNTPNNAEVEPI